MRFCIILGSAKSGTTSLFNYLAQHPEIAPCSNKEPNFFSLKYDLGDSWYFSLWDKDVINNKVLLESTVNYTNRPASPDSSENMMQFHKRHDVSMKFIYIMRNPIDRMESHYTYNFIHRTNWDIEKALDKGYFTRASCYAEQLNPYFEKFNHEDFLLLDFDELKCNPDQLLRNICVFLNIDPAFDFQGTKKIHNKTEGSYISRKWENLNRKYPFIQPCANLFPKSIRRTIFRLIFRKKVTGHFKLSESQRQRVYDEVKDDMARLHEKYGVDVSKWGF
ncbi:MAG: sulfotransferase domain-containing protein [Planctomycetota bacterium]|jgi:hypothetical protein